MKTSKTQSHGICHIFTTVAFRSHISLTDNRFERSLVTDDCPGPKSKNRALVFSFYLIMCQISSKKTTHVNCGEKQSLRSYTGHTKVGTNQTCNFSWNKSLRSYTGHTKVDKNNVLAQLAAYSKEQRNTKSHKINWLDLI